MNQIKRNLAIVIGINEYTHPIPRLNTAANDAKALADILEKRYQYRVLSLLDREATHEKLNSLLNNLAENKSIELPDGQIRVQSDDRVLFYFAGHGFPRDAQESEDCKPAGFWIPQDGQLENSSTWLSMQALHDALTALECRHLLIILDCCFAGRFHWAGVTRNIGRSRRVYRQSYDRFVKHQAQQVITSAAHDEEALDALCRFGQRGEENGHSPFADLLLKVLDGKSDRATDSYLKAITEDGVVTAHELFTYLQNKLGQIAEQQTPCFFHLKKHDKGEYIFQPPNFNPEKLEKLKLNKDTNPYKGLESFEKKDSNLFFGRKTLIQKLCEFVTENSLTVVLGLSGSGKSSLVKAGLIPALESVEGNEQNSQQQWQILKPIRPEDAPFSALNIALTEQNLPKVAKPGEALGQGTLAESLEVWRQRHPGSKLLLVIDQSEELITLCRDDREREDFLRSLTEALASENLSDQLRIVLTLRSDFEPQIRDAIEHTHWQEAWQDGRFVVTQMNRQELQEAIEEPAAARALFFESPKLINQLIDEVIQMPGALPLLSFTLSELYLMYLKAEEKEERSDRTITEADYKTLGGVTLSLTKRADQEYKALVDEDPAYERTIRNITLRMVAMSRGELARRQVPLSELEYPEPEENNRVEEVRRRFVEARLTVEGLDASGNKYVEPAHDELVRGWTKLRNWIDKAPESLSLQQHLTLTAAANDWKEKEQANYLWNSNPYLALLEKVVNSNNSWLNQLETDFVKSSIHKRDEELIETEKQIISVFSSNSKDFLASDQHLEAIVEAVKAGKKLKQLQNQYSFWTDAALNAQVRATLSQVVYGMRERNRWLGYCNWATSISFRPDGQMLVSASEYTIKLWSLEGKELQTIQGHSHVTSVGFSPDGQMLASASGDGTIKLWSRDGKEIRTLYGHSDWVTTISFSRDGQMLASASHDQTIRLWSLDGKELRTIQGHSYVTSVSISRDGQMLASASHDAIKLWSRDGKELRTLNEPDNWFNSISFSPDGQMLASASGKGTIKLWSLDGKELRTLNGHIKEVTSVSFSPNGQMLASVSRDGTIKLWSLDGKELGTLHGHSNWVNSISFSPDGQMLASASSDQTIRLWSLNRNPLRTLPHSNAVTSISFSPNGQMLASGSCDGTIKLWSRDGKEIRTLYGHSDRVTSISFSPDGQMLASASDDDTIKLWSLDGKELRTLKWQSDWGYSTGVDSASFSPNGQMLAAAVNEGTAFWSLDGNQIMTLHGHGAPVADISFSRDGQMLASAGFDNKINLWKLNNIDTLNVQKPWKDLPGHIEEVTSVSFSPDGQMLASAGLDKIINIWSCDGNKIAKLTGHTDGVTSISFSPDSKMLVSASHDQTIKLWSWDGKVIGTLKEHSDAVNSISFSPDGKILASASDDGTVLLWNLELDDLLVFGCNLVCDYLKNPSANLHESDRDLCDNIPASVASREISSGDTTSAPTVNNPDKLVQSQQDGSDDTGTQG